MKKNILIGGNLFLAFSTMQAQSKPTPPPNIILIMADDLGWGDVGFNGNQIIQTPHLDKLASEGVTLSRFYSAAPLSSPTRASVLTGRNAFRTGVFTANEGILRPEEITLSEILQSEGYRTGHFGKWHLGTLTDKETDANRGRPENKHLFNPPALHGFDVAFVTESKVPTYDPMKQPVENDGRFWDYIQHNDSALCYGTAYWDERDMRVTDGLTGDNSRVITDRAISFIGQSVGENNPFLSVIWYHTPHLPCVAGPEHAAIYKDYPLDERNYFGCITAMDEQVGRLIAYLKNLNVYENTLILFCSDNGPELNTPGSAGRLRGKKRSLYEGGIRVPAFMAWQGRIKPSSEINAPCSTTDYLPTILDVLGVEYPEYRELDGESFWPMITGATSDKTKPLIFCSDKQGAFMQGQYKLYYSDGTYELYDIESDPSEKENIVARYPKKVEEMKKTLSAQLKNYEKSFLGKEYGRKSYDKVEQKWWNIWKK